MAAPKVLSPDEPHVEVCNDGKLRQRRKHASGMATVLDPGDGSRRLRDHRHEEMARLIGVRGMDQDDAYRVAYQRMDAPLRLVKKQAQRIVQNQKAVALRIQYLTDQAIRREIQHVTVSREWVSTEMVDTYKDARNCGDHKAAIKALELCGVELGMFIRRSDVTVRKDQADLGNPRQILEQYVLHMRRAFPGLDLAVIRKEVAERLGVPLDQVPQLAETIEGEIVPEIPAEAGVDAQETAGA